MTAEKAQINARIDPDLKAKAELAAWREHKSLTAWLTEAMQEKLRSAPRAQRVPGSSPGRPHQVRATMARKGQDQWKPQV